jgi:5' nucleotidase family
MLATDGAHFNRCGLVPRTMHVLEGFRVWCPVRCTFSKGLGFGAPYDARSRSSGVCRCVAPIFLHNFVRCLRAFCRHWGYLSRAGLNDKSQFTRQIEKYADIYTSRVSNFLRYTPYM